MFKKLIGCLAMACLFGIGAVISQEKAKSFTADRHKERGMACVGCHKEEQPKTAAEAASCLACHKSLESVGERTKDFVQNPHQNHITDSSDVQCTQCHQSHKEDTILCHNCHAGMKFERQPAETK